MKTGNIYKCINDTIYIVIQETDKENTKYIVVNNRFDYCCHEESKAEELLEELKDFELINA